MSTFEKLIALPKTHESYAHDFEKRFNGSFLLQGGKTPLFVGSRIDSNIYAFHPYGGTGYTPINIKDIKIDDLEVWLPESGFYAKKDTLIYLYQVPQRQWTRSFCQRTYKWTIYGKGSGRTIHAADVAKFITEGEITNLEKWTGTTCVALSRHFGIIFGLDKEAYLMYRNVYVGKLDIEKRCITLNHIQIQQEVEDLLNRTGVTTWNLQLTKTS